MDRERPQAGAPPVTGDGLERLLAAERRLDRELAEACTRGEEIVTAARSEIERQRERFEARLAAALDNLRSTLERNLADELATIEQEAERQIALYDSAAGHLDDLAAEVARSVVRETLGATTPSSGGAGVPGEAPP